MGLGQVRGGDRRQRRRRGRQRRGSFSPSPTMRTRRSREFRRAIASIFPFGVNPACQSVMPRLCATGLTASGGPQTAHDKIEPARRRRLNDAAIASGRSRCRIGISAVLPPCANASQDAVLSSPAATVAAERPQKPDCQGAPPHHRSARARPCPALRPRPHKERVRPRSAPAPPPADAQLDKAEPCRTPEKVGGNSGSVDDRIG